MKTLKQIFFLTLTLAFVFTLNQEAVAEQSAFQWQIEAINKEKIKNLETTSVFIEYGGGEVPVNHADKPKDGHTYYLLDLNITKSKAGGKGFDWKDVKIVDSKGNTHLRHSNDTFLSTYGLDRLAATRLQLAKNRGWVCFELPDSAFSSTLYLIHNSEQGENKIQLN